MIFDSHAHYDDEAFDEDRNELLHSMSSNGVECIVNVGASMETSARSIQLAEQYDNIYAAVGVHPNETGALTENDMQQLVQWSKNPKVVAIGEIGLDYHFLEPEEKVQKNWFRKQLEVAVETRLPVIIHSRDAAKDTMDILKEFQGKLSGGVIHCYSYSEEMVKEYLKMGYFIGIGGVLTFKNAKKLKEVASFVPLERIVLETDCPYLAPEPNRGKRNDSTNIRYVVQKMAEIKDVSEQQVIDVTNAAARQLYGIKSY